MEHAASAPHRAPGHADTPAGARPEVGAALAIADEARDLVDEIERAGRLPDALVDALSAAGLYQLYLPAAAGGPEADPLTTFLVTEALARVDGSLAWCVSISSAVSQYLAWLRPDVLAELGGDPPRFRLAGSARPLGHAEPVPGGYRATGRWDFASNVLHATVYAGTCLVARGEGPPTPRAVIVPVEQGEVVPTWDVVGMRGSGSHDFQLTDVFVPEGQLASARVLRARDELLYHPRLTGVMTWSPTVGVALGLARGALDAFGELARRPTAGSPLPLRERTDVQLAVGRAEAITSAARSFVVEAVTAAWEAVGRQPARLDPGADPALDATVARARLAITHGMQEAVRAVDLLFGAAGTAGIFTRHHLERRFRDVHVAVQHAAGLDVHLAAAARVGLGLPADAPYF